jgi:hypothetical protein
MFPRLLDQNLTALGELGWNSVQFQVVDARRGRKGETSRAFG